MKNLKHRNSQKRIYIPNTAYFITTKTYGNFPYFRETVFCDLFVENLRVCKQLKRFKLYGWFLGYDHVHLLIEPGDQWNISEVMFSIKKQFSHDVNRVMGFNKMYPHLNFGKQTTQSHLKKADKRLSAFGDGERLSAFGDGERLSAFGDGERLSAFGLTEYQMIVTRFREKFILQYPIYPPIPTFRWQEKFHDHYIRNSKDFENHLNYIAGNPDKHVMPKKWSYVSIDPKFMAILDDF